MSSKQLWTEKYKPDKIIDIISQKKGIEESLEWFNHWKSGKSKALFLYGQPGIGKSLLIEALAKESKYYLVALNASDKRNSKELEELSSGTKTHSLFHKGKIILLDEVDGISGNDRGAVTAITNMIKESSFPVVLIANDPWKQKLRPLRNYCTLVKFNKVHSVSLEKRLRDICDMEGVHVEGDVLKNLARWSNGDLRSAIQDLQMVCKGKKILNGSCLETLGYRERGAGVFDIMPAIFNSRNIKATRKAIFDCSQDPDEIFWWVESNAATIFKTPEELSKAFDILSKADIFRARVMKQQNWRFKAYMVDLISAISLARRTDSYGYTPYNPPKRLVEMGKTMFKRAKMKEVCSQLGETLHCSSRLVKAEYLPYLKQIVKSNDLDEISEKLGL